MRNAPTPEPNATSLDYVDRVNRAIDYIVTNLADPIRLEDVASVAHFSTFHFHRVFRSLVGEPLNQFVNRLRLERALSMLSHRRTLSLTDIALACGFSSSSDFSRSFKKRYGVPPSTIDIDVFRNERRDDWTSAVTDPKHRNLLRGLPPGENPDGFEVCVRDLPPRRVAYLRVLDPYRPDVVAEAAARFVQIAEDHGVADGKWLGYMWDDPDIVAHEDCRYDVGLVLPETCGWTVPDGEIGRFDFPEMRVAEVEIRGGIDLEMRALDWLFKTWLPQSGFVPSAQPSFEAWIGRPFAHGYEHFELFAQIPVARG